MRDEHGGFAQVLPVVGRSRVDGLHHDLHDSFSKYRIDRDLGGTTAYPIHPDREEIDLVGHTNRVLHHSHYFDEILDEANAIVVDRPSVAVRTRRI